MGRIIWSDDYVSCIEFATVNAICTELYVGAKPMRSSVQVVALPWGAKIKIDAIAI